MGSPGTASLPQVASDLLDLSENAEKVKAGDLFQVVRRVAAAVQFGKQSGIAGHVFKALYCAVKALEIRADADVFDAGHAADVVDVIGDVI